jgi:hypothetical protein
MHLALIKIQARRTDVLGPFTREVLKERYEYESRRFLSNW